MPRNTSYTEDDLQNAIIAVENGLSQMEAQRLYGVPRQTLQSRRRGAVCMAAAKTRYQRLTPRQEELVCDWIRYEKYSGLRPSNDRIKAFACTLLPVEDSRKLGKNWLRGFFSRHPETKRIYSSPSLVTSALPRENDSSLYWRKAVHLQRNIFDSARSDTRWISPSKFDYQGAPQTNHILKCSMMHFNDGDPKNAGRMLRKAFITLEHELSEGSLTVVQDVSLNIFGITLSYKHPEIGCLMLRHCKDLFESRYVNRLYGVFFDCLTHVFCQDQAQSEYYLSQLSMLYAIELDNVRSCNDRSSIHANRRYRLITRDSKNKAAAQDFEEMQSRLERLLAKATSELGPLHDKTLRILNEALRMQNYVHEYDANYIQRIHQAKKDLENKYASTHFEDWEQFHQSANLRLLEREFEYHKDHVDHKDHKDHKHLDKAEAAAKRIFELEKYQTERWIVFSMQFESWLHQIEQEKMCARFKEERLRSEYYRKLEAAESSSA